MATSTNHRESWDSLSSTFANLEISISQDSCYGSDEISVTSNTTTPLQSSASPCVAKREEPSLHPFLKSILKNSITEAQDDTESESGYGSDEIELDYDALSEDEDDEDDMSDFSVWDETSGDVPEVREDHTELFDDSFIGFETMVRFAPKVEYIDTPDVDCSDDEEGSGSQMTCHEMMLLAQQSSHSQATFHETDAGDITDDEDDTDHKEFVRTTINHPEEFTRDAVDVDRSLFVAYMNGMHAIADTKYKTYLRNQVDNIRLGHDTESTHPDDASCMYLDLVLGHVVGIFRNLLAAEELNELVALRKEDLVTEHVLSGSAHLVPPQHQTLLAKIERFLLDRLANGRVDVCPDELCFFAGGIAHALGTPDLPASA
ncbi:uncharacterized protein N7459_009414 [Penicillium hispanicum]|uniref:uncharacterized protein n=1 Tax=Penicillium hispanicum TaxID=1080232 RepID=UPI00253FC365|nr:uncharacterized protein N7459_009414 [Penicillium hispanicum]KAJ5569984.1 hypothetical protein N7459_009414 [Penicillium hispanicum]